MRKGLLDTSKRRQKPNTKATMEEPKKLEPRRRRQQQQQQQQQQQEEAYKSSIPELPNSILLNILSTLPFKTIHMCKCVCKTWLDIVSDPYFAETHFKFSKTCILAHPFLININPKPKSPFVLDWEVPNVFGCDVIVKFDPNAMRLSNKCMMVGSCDGLVCLMCPLLCGSFCVCNPISGEYVMVPSNSQWGCHSFLCFGLSPKANKYKIVKFSDGYDHWSSYRWMSHIFTIGMDNSWRSIGESLSLGGDPNGPFTNGRIHWVVTNCNNSEFIRCFDFDCEGFQSVFPPKEFGADHKEKRKWMNLGLMDDCLCLCDHSVDSYLDIWLMKEYGVQESWTKMFVISASITYTARLKNYLPIRLFYNGQCLIFFNHKVLVSYNLEREKFTEVEVGEIGACIDGALAYKPSFILLKEIARRQNWELVDIRRHMW